MTRPHWTRARLLTAPLALVAASALSFNLDASLGSAPATPAAAASQQVAPHVKLTLNKLEQGDPPAEPFMTYDGRLVDGEVDLEVKGKVTTLLGEYDGTYVYARHSQRGTTTAVLRVAPDGTTTPVTSVDGADMIELSDDGTTLVALSSGKRKSKLEVIDVATGTERVAATLELGWPHLLDVDADQVLLGSWDETGSYAWDIATQELARITKRVGYQGDIALDRLAFLTGDPYRNGCSIVRTLSSPAEVLTKSCTERVYSFSPDGARTANVHLLSDGIGPGRVVVRTSTGKRVATFDAPLYFGRVYWEDADTLILETSSRKRWALVRCTLDDCEIAASLGMPMIRPVAPRADWSPH